MVRTGSLNSTYLPNCKVYICYTSLTHFLVDCPAGVKIDRIFHPDADDMTVKSDVSDSANIFSISVNTSPDTTVFMDVFLSEIGQDRETTKIFLITIDMFRDSTLNVPGSRWHFTRHDDTWGWFLSENSVTIVKSSIRT